MALRTVIDHFKFEDLRAALNLSRFEALGILESLWHFTARFAPAGDIGRCKDSQILSWLGWKNEKGDLINALVQSGWLDRHDGHRLVVHDWHEHADTLVHTELAKKTLLFATGHHPKINKTYLNGDTRKRIKAEYEAKYPNGGQVPNTSPPSPPSSEEPGDKSSPILNPQSSFLNPNVSGDSGDSGNKVDNVFQDLPKQFDTSPFKAKWLEWEQYHRTVYDRAIQPFQRSPGWQTILTEFGANVSPEIVVAALTKAMAQGWKKPYPPDDGGRTVELHQLSPEQIAAKNADNAKYEAKIAEAKRQHAERLKKGSLNATAS